MISDCEAFGAAIDELNSRSPFEDKDASCCAEYDAQGYVTVLGVREFRLDPRDILLIARCRKVRLLALSETNVGTLALGPLKSLTKLERFYVEDTTVTSNDLRFLQNIHTLTWIGMDHTRVDNRIFEFIGDNPDLEHLGVSGTQVDLPLTKILEFYPKLNHLVISEDRYTPQDIETAKEQRPGLEVFALPDEPCRKR